MLISSGLSASLTIKGALFKKNGELLIVFKQKCQILTFKYSEINH